MDSPYSQPLNRYQLINFELGVFCEFELTQEGKKQALAMRKKLPVLWRNKQVIKALQLDPGNVETGIIYQFGKAE